MLWVMNEEFAPVQNTGKDEEKTSELTWDKKGRESEGVMGAQKHLRCTIDGPDSSYSCKQTD